MRGALAILLACHCLGSWLAPGAACALTPVVGDEFVLAPSEGEFRFLTDVSTADGTELVVVWIERDPGSGTARVGFTRLVGAEPIPGSDVPVSGVLPDDSVDSVGVAHAPAGRFLVAWSAPSGGGGGDGDILARLYDATGSPLTSELVVNSATVGDQVDVRVAARSDGSFVVVWRDEGGVDHDISAAVIDPDGAVSVSEFAVNTYTTDHQRRPDVAAAGDDTFVIVWEDYAVRDGDSRAVFAQRFDAGALPIGGDFQVNTYTTSAQGYPRIASFPGGGFLVAWQNTFNPGKVPSLQRLDAAGALDGGEIELVGAPSNAGGLELATLAGGEFRVAWDPNFGAIVGRFDATGTPLSDPISVTNAAETDRPSDPKIASAANGDIVAVWNTNPIGTLQFRAAFSGAVCVDDGADADADDIGDRCDVCPDGSELLSIKPKLSTKFINTNPVFHDERVQLAGEFDLPPASTFAGIDPTVHAVRFRLETVDGLPVLDATLSAATFAGSGTAGWKVNNSGTKWAYRDKTTAPRAGIVSMLLQDRSKKSPGRVRMKIKGRDGLYYVYQNDEPLRAAVSVGDPAVGECVETDFMAAECVFRALDTALRCKR